MHNFDKTHKFDKIVLRSGEASSVGKLRKKKFIEGSHDRRFPTDLIFFLI